jgi:hypothetical protein
MAAPTRRPCLCRRVGYPVRIFIRRIRCATQLGQKRAFVPAHHTAFQALLGRYGVPELLALKQKVVDSMTAGWTPETTALPNDRFARTTVRVALRQMLTVGPLSPALTAWLSVYDRLDPADAENPMETLH